MKKVFNMMLRIGLLALLYTGVSGGIDALVNYGLLAGVWYMFIPFGMTPFWAIFTLLQDILIIVGLIGTIVTRNEVETTTFEAVQPEAATTVVTNDEATTMESK